MDIILAETENLKEIVALWLELNELHYEISTHFKDHFATFTFSQRCEQLQQKDQLKIFLAIMDSEPIGYCIATVADTTGEVDSLFIRKKYRVCGIAGKLMDKAIKWLKKSDCDEIIVQVVEGNESAIPFYEQYGFKRRFITLQKVQD